MCSVHDDTMLKNLELEFGTETVVKKILEICNARMETKIFIERLSRELDEDAVIKIPSYSHSFSCDAGEKTIHIYRDENKIFWIDVNELAQAIGVKFDLNNTIGKVLRKSKSLGRLTNEYSKPFVCKPDAIFKSLLPELISAKVGEQSKLATTFLALWSFFCTKHPTPEVIYPDWMTESPEKDADNS